MENKNEIWNLWQYFYGEIYKIKRKVKKMLMYIFSTITHQNYNYFRPFDKTWLFFRPNTLHRTLVIHSERNMVAVKKAKS